MPRGLLRGGDLQLVEGEGGSPAVKNLGKSSVGWGCQQVHVVGVRSLLVASSAEGKWCWKGGHRGGCVAREQDRTGTHRA